MVQEKQYRLKKTKWSQWTAPIQQGSIFTRTEDYESGGYWYSYDTGNLDTGGSGRLRIEDPDVDEWLEPIVEQTTQELTDSEILTALENIPTGTLKKAHSSSGGCWWPWKIAVANQKTSPEFRTLREAVEFCVEHRIMRIPEKTEE